jgi:hypothetical protein
MAEVFEKAARSPQRAVETAHHALDEVSEGLEPCLARDEPIHLQRTLSDTGTRFNMTL